MKRKKPEMFKSAILFVFQQMDTVISWQE